MSNLQLMNIGLERVPDMARLHVESFSDRALSALGEETVRRYYESQMDGFPEVSVLGAFENDRLLGFCVCGLTGNAFGKFMARHKKHLVCRMLSRPWLLCLPVVRQQARWALCRGRGSSKKPDNQPVFRILSIGVSPSAQGRGIGAALMNAAERIAAEQGHVEMGLSVHPENTKALRLYERLGWHRVTTGTDWTGSMIKRLS